MSPRAVTWYAAVRDQTADPMKAPMPAVMAIASAPQKLTRIVGRSVPAQPVRAPR